MTKPLDDARGELLAKPAKLSIKYVLQEAREGQRFHAQNNAPYTAGMLGDCIAAIEQLQGQLAAPVPQCDAVTDDHSTDNIDWDVMAEERLGQRPQSEHGRHIPQTSPAPGCDSGSHSAHRDVLAVASPPSEAGREAIARIIDPTAKFDKILNLTWSRYEIQRRDLAYAKADAILALSPDQRTVTVASGPTAEDIRACAWSTLIGWQHELGDSIDFICDQIARKATVPAVSSTHGETPS